MLTGTELSDPMPTALPLDRNPVAHVRTRLLVVEDHELVAATLVLALRQHGLVVEAVAGPSPQAVVEVARRMAPVLVLLDLELGPLGSGIDLVHPLIDVGAQVVMMTGVVDRPRLAACLEAGAAGIVSKASGFTDLIDAVRRAAVGETLVADDHRQDLLAELSAHRQADREEMAPFAGLTPREEAVLARLVAGETAEVIAASCYVSLATTRSHIRSILRKLGVKSQLAAVARARHAGWPRARS